jgi:hypothetical protein
MTQIATHRSAMAGRLTGRRIRQCRRRRCENDDRAHVKQGARAATLSFAMLTAVLPHVASPRHSWKDDCFPSGTEAHGQRLEPAS